LGAALPFGGPARATEDVAPAAEPLARRRADLKPVSSGGGHCELNGNTLTVRVKNVGDARAGESHTLISFGNKRYHKSTPALDPGAEHVMTVTLPAGCFDPDCGFTLNADEKGVVQESSETNNHVAGNCVG
jgi:hypothetical protein